MSYKIELDDKDLQILNDLLVNAPFKVAAPLINKINNQIRDVEPDIVLNPRDVDA